MTITVKIFVKNNCPNCPKAKVLIKEFVTNSISYKEFNVDTLDGMAEAAFHSIMATPSVILVNEEDRIEKGWYGMVPTLSEIEELLKDV
jgi:glutaredoxin